MAQHYNVEWQIHVYQTTPVEAAKEAFEDMQRPFTTATVFTVTDENGDFQTIDLLEHGLYEELSKDVLRPEISYFEEVFNTNAECILGPDKLELVISRLRELQKLRKLVNSGPYEAYQQLVTQAALVVDAWETTALDYMELIECLDGQEGSDAVIESRELYDQLSDAVETLKGLIG